MLDDGDGCVANFIKQWRDVGIEQKVCIDIGKHVDFLIALHHIPSEAGGKRPTILRHATLGLGLEQGLIFDFTQCNADNKRQIQTFQNVLGLGVHAQHINPRNGTMARQAAHHDQPLEQVATIEQRAKIFLRYQSMSF